MSSKSVLFLYRGGGLSLGSSPEQLLCFCCGQCWWRGSSGMQQTKGKSSRFT